METLQRVDLVKDTIQQAIDRGVRSVEEIHQYVAGLPFEALARAGLFDDQRWQLRQRQRRTIAMIYEAIRHINGEVGRLVSDQIENVEDTRGVAERLRADA
jgi:hypothetical protein